MKKDRLLKHKIVSSTPGGALSSLLGNIEFGLGFDTPQSRESLIDKWVTDCEGALLTSTKTTIKGNIRSDWRKPSLTISSFLRLVSIMGQKKIKIKVEMNIGDISIVSSTSVDLDGLKAGKKGGSASTAKTASKTECLGRIIEQVSSAVGVDRSDKKKGISLAVFFAEMFKLGVRGFSLLVATSDPREEFYVEIFLGD